MLEIGDKGDWKNRQLELADRSKLSRAAIAGQALAWFATGEVPVMGGEVTALERRVRNAAARDRSETRIKIRSRPCRRKMWGGGLFQGVHLWDTTAETDRSGVLRIPFAEHKDARLRCI